MIKPTGEMILVLPDAESEPGTTPAGLHLPKNQEQQIAQAVVIRAGEGRIREDGSVVSMIVKEGDKVLVSRASGLSIYVDGKLHKLMPGNQVLAIVE